MYVHLRWFTDTTKLTRSRESRNKIVPTAIDIVHILENYCISLDLRGLTDMCPGDLHYLH